MRTRITFLAGFAVGFVAGARAGRERYEQMVKLGRKAVENPTVQQATRAAGSKATELSKAAGQKAAERAPKLAEAAKNTASKARSSASKVRIPGRNSAGDDTSAVNGTRPVD
jgi:hypothetical protein